ncbi:MAG: dTMP kinase [Deltaproteobacteria bacterium]|nr:dTMP kinase [Deltaproteobacteria bacterium]
MNLPSAHSPSPDTLTQALRGRFITLEGVDGCGKSTQARLLADRLRRAGCRVTETREPGGTPLGMALRAVLLDPLNDSMAPVSELLLYLADRVQHLRQVIRPALARGDVVVCDRFHDATVAYQSHARGLSLEPLAAFIAAEIAPTQPHLTLWLDVDLTLARERITTRAAQQGRASTGAGREGRIDSLGPEFHRKVREGYAALHQAHPDRIVCVSGAGGVSEISARIWSVVEARHGV